MLLFFVCLLIKCNSVSLKFCKRMIQLSFIGSINVSLLETEKQKNLKRNEMLQKLNEINLKYFLNTFSYSKIHNDQRMKNGAMRNCVVAVSCFSRCHVFRTIFAQFKCKFLIMESLKVFKTEVKH